MCVIGDVFGRCVVSEEILMCLIKDVGLNDVVRDAVLRCVAGHAKEIWLSGLFY